jgi:hypothetical protein
LRRGEKDRGAGQVTVKGRIGRCSRCLISDGKKIDEQELGWTSKQKNRNRLGCFLFHFISNSFLVFFLLNQDQNHFELG